jgi:hypothetical protein
LRLNDNSLLVLYQDSIARILPDGRAFWRTVLDRPAVAVTGLQGTAVIHFADGWIQVISPDGTLGDFWQVPISITGEPYDLGAELVFPSAAGGLVALDNRRRTVLWQSSDAPTFTGSYVAPQVVGLLTDSELVTVARTDGTMIDRAQFTHTPSLATAADGTLLVYGSGGLWRVLNDGTWERSTWEAPTPISTSAAVTVPANGDTVLFDGTTLHRFDRNGAPLTQTPITDVRGRVTLTSVDGVLLLISTFGDIAAIRVDGSICRVSAWGRGDGRVWYDLGTDNTLRVLIGSTLVGVDWERFSGACPVS